MYLQIFGYDLHLGSASGKFFVDNVSMIGVNDEENIGGARATSVQYSSGVYSNIKSGMSGQSATFAYELKGELNDPEPTPANPAPTPDDGNLPRNHIARVRCIYKP